MRQVLVGWLVLSGCPSGGDGDDSAPIDLQLPRDYLVGRDLTHFATLPPGWGGLGPAFIAAGRDGFFIQELSSDAPTYEAVDVLYKAQGIRRDGFDFMVAVGPTGYTTSRWVPEMNGFGFFLINPISPNVTDIVRDDTDPNDPRFVIANNTFGQIVLVEYQNGAYERTATIEPEMALPGVGRVVAVEVLPDGRILAATETTTTTPGNLVVATVEDGATLIGEIGAAPRDLACAVEFCLVSNNGSGTVHVIDIRSGDPTIAAELQVGPQPLWIEMLTEGSAGALTPAQTRFFTGEAVVGDEAGPEVHRVAFNGGQPTTDPLTRGSSLPSYQAKRVDAVLEFGGEIGGPLVKDRLWIWGSGNRNKIENSVRLTDDSEIQGF